MHADSHACRLSRGAPGGECIAWTTGYCECRARNCETSSEITVTSEAPTVQAENGDVSVTLNQKQISEVPNPGNDLTYIVQTAPGVVIPYDFSLLQARGSGRESHPGVDQRQLTDYPPSKYCYSSSTAKSRYAVRLGKERQIPRTLHVVPTTDLSFPQGPRSAGLQRDFCGSRRLDFFRLKSNSCNRGLANHLEQSRWAVVLLEKGCESLHPRSSALQAGHHREIGPNGSRVCERGRCQIC